VLLRGDSALRKQSGALGTICAGSSTTRVMLRKGQAFPGTHFPAN
jgi:hypothetical protein